MTSRAFACALALAACAGLAGAAGATRSAAMRPTIALAANGVAAGVARPGWPIVVTAILVPGADTTGAPLVPPAPAIAPRIVDAHGASVELALAPAGPSVQNGEVTQWAWIVAEAATRALAPGAYRVVTDTTGLTSTFRFAMGALNVEAASAAPDRRTSLLRIDVAAIGGRLDDAMVETDRMIAADSSDVEAWTTLGDLLLAKDEPARAYHAYGQAWARRQSGDEAIDLARRRSAAFTRMLEKRGVLLPKPTGR